LPKKERPHDPFFAFSQFVAEVAPRRHLAEAEQAPDDLLRDAAALRGEA
jgi:hypothetical protein